jgi:hypothetical protein
MALDLRIECLRIEIADAAGHEHRIHQIASRAAAIFGERLSERLAGSDGAASHAAGVVQARPVHMNLNATGSEQVAESIAQAWLEALTVRLKI